MKNKLLVAFLAVVSSIQAATVSEPVTVNSYERSAPALQFYSGNGITIPITLKNGSAVANITNLTPFFSWSPSNASSHIVTAQCSIVNATAGTFNAVFTPQKLNTNGTFIYEAGARDSNGYPVVYRQGVFQIVRSPFSSGVNPVEYVSQIDFSVVLPVNAPWIRTNAPDGVTIIYSNGVLTAIAAAAPDLVARQAIIDETNRAQIAEAALYPRNNPSGFVGSAVLAGYVATNDTRYLAALTNAAAFATAAQGARADLALTNSAAFASSGLLITINGTAGTLNSNLNFTVPTNTVIANAVTNGGATVNGQAISNGAAITITAGGNVASVNGYTGVVVLTAEDVGALDAEADPLSVHTTNATYTATVAKAASALQDASTWSQYAAGQMVDLGNNGITNAGTFYFLEWAIQTDGYIKSLIDGNFSTSFGSRRLYDSYGNLIFDWSGTGLFFGAATKLQAGDITDNSLTTNQMDATADTAYRNPANMATNRPVIYCNSGTGCVLSASDLYAAWTVTLTGNWTVAISPAMTPGQQWDIEVAHSTSNQVITWPANVKAQKAGVSLSDTNTTGFTDWYTLKCRGTNSTTALATNLFKFTGIQ